LRLSFGPTTSREEEYLVQGPNVGVFLIKRGETELPLGTIKDYKEERASITPKPFFFFQKALCVQHIQSTLLSYKL